MTGLTVIDRETGEVLADEPVRLGTLRATNPAQLLAAAQEIATPLAKLIKDRKLASRISGREFVRCEGWTTLAALLGCTPHEVSVSEDEGVYTATVELRRLSDGQAVARASAECGAPDETDRDGKPLWAARPRYARRSMALTRATAKAARLAFSWVMVLAGYEATPAEEVPSGGFDGRESEGELPDTIPFGKDKGKKLADCSVEHLQSIRQWCQDKGKFADLVDAIDLELDGRRGQA